EKVLNGTPDCIVSAFAGIFQIVPDRESQFTDTDPLIELSRLLPSMMQVPEAGHAATALFSLTAKSAPGCVSAKITTPLRLLMVRPVKSRLNPEIFPSGQ